MRDLEVQRRQRRRISQRACGFGWENPMIHAGDAAMNGHAAVLILPTTSSAPDLLGTNGEPLMMLGMMGLENGNPLQ
jgi:hypothetical protein